MCELMGYRDKVCVITGAASGMGKAATEMLVEMGAKVYALDVNAVTTPGIEKSVRVNLADKQSIDDAFKQLPDSIDRFFGVAGVSGVQTNYHLTVTINFIANKYMTDEYLDKRMGDGGSITYISSMGGTHWDKYMGEYRKMMNATGWDGTVAELHRLAPADAFRPFCYTMSKRAMNGYAASKTVYFAKKGIRINVVMPGSTDTGMKKEFEELVGGAYRLVANAGVAGRLATPAEMAGPLLFMGSDMASFITGARLPVDYGDETLAILKLKKDLQNVPMGLKIYNTKLVKKILTWYVEKS